MNTYTVTLHDTDNSGSSLQAFALQHYLIKNNIDNQIIDYVPSYMRNNGSAIKTFIRNIVYFKDSLSRKKKFNEFKQNHLITTSRRYKTIKQINSDMLKCDCFITGSDQLWNSSYKCGNDPVYYLEFAKNTKKIAYAVSVGKDVIPKDNINIIKKHVKGFAWISVREKSTVEQLEPTIPKIKIDNVCDPVLLNEPSDYDDIKSQRLVKDNYILVYVAQMPNTDYINKVIKAVKKKNKAKVVLIGAYRNRCYSDIQIRNTAPGEFLSLIYYADYVISNSFHATMFSLLYEKQFISILPKENGARIKDILDMLSLGSNYITPEEEILSIPIINDYSRIRKAISDFRSSSRKKLKKHLLGEDYE